MAISSNGTVLARLAGGLYNQTLSNSDFTSINAAIKTAADINTFANEAFARDFAGKTDAQVATTLLANLGLSSVAGLNNWVAAQLTAAGSAKGAKIVSMLNDFAGMTADATYGAAATSFNTKTSSALALSQKAGAVGGDFNAAATIAAAEAAAAAAAATAAAEAAAKAAAAAAAAEAAAAAKAAADAAAAKAAADAAAAAPKVLTTADAETLNGTSANETFNGLVSTTASKTTFNSGDVITDNTTTDSDTFNLTLEDDYTAGASVRNVENIVVNLDASTTGGTAGELSVAVTNMSGVKNYSFDVTRELSGVTSLAVVDAEDGSKVTASNDFKAINVEVETAGDDITVDAKAIGTAGTPTTVTINAATDAGDVTVTGSGHLKVVSADSTGVVRATAEKSLVVDAAHALVIKGQAKDGAATILNGDAAVIIDLTATSDIAVTDTGAGSLSLVTPGTITVDGTISSTTATLSSAGASSLTNADALSYLEISGNGGAATYTLATSHNALTDVAVSGSQNVTLKVIAADVDGIAGDRLSVVDTGSGTFTLEVGTTKGNVDLRSGSLIDVLKLKVDSNAKTLSVKTGQTVTITADQTTAATTIAVGSAALEATNTLAIKLDDAARDSAAVDITGGLTIVDAKTVTIDASIDTTVGGTANPSTITALDASDAKSNVTVNAGVNGVTFAGTNTMGSTGTLTVTSSGAVALGTATLTAASFDASAVTGAVTFTGLKAEYVPTIKTGSAADIITLADTNDTSLTLVTGAGNDTVTLAAVAFSDAANAVSIDLGEGTADTLVFQNGSVLSKTTGGSVTLAGVENITFDATSTTQGIQASLLNGATYAVKASATSANGSINATVASTDTALDFSKLVLSEAVDTTVAGMSLVVDASSNTSGITITGGTKIKNNITGSQASDTLTGGTLNDTFNYSSDALLFTSDNVMYDSITGGAGNADILNVGGSSAFEIVALDSFAKMSGVERITAGASATGGLSITLGTSAETAGITNINIASGGSTSNTVSVAAYTSTGVSITGDSGAASTLTGGAGADSITGGSAADNITGGAGNDRITAAGGADTLSGGLGDDTFVFSTVAHFNSTGIVPASIAGGDGTDTISITASTGGWTLANTEVWTVVTSVETLTAAANSGAISISLDSTAWAAGLRTVDISADTATAAVSNVIDADEITTGPMVLKGGADEDSIKGGSGADTITGGDGVDTLVGGGGNDVYVFASTADLNDNDAITFVPANDKLDFSAFLGSGYTVLGASGIDTSITAISGTSDVNIASKIVLIEEANGTADYDTVAEIFAAIDGSGDMMALSSGKAVIIRQVDGAANSSNSADALIFYIDTARDGASGLSAEDIVIVGTLTDMAGALSVTFTTDNFV